MAAGQPDSTPLLLSAEQAANLLGINVSTFRKKLKTDPNLQLTQHESFSSEKCRKFSRKLIERYAAMELDPSNVPPSLARRLRDAS